MKKRLFTPGPTPVPESVMLRMAEPMIHHRHVEFTQLFARLHENLQYLFQTTGDVITLTSSGTGAMEATVANVHSAGEKALFVNGGKFGERWGEILKVYGVEPVELTVPWGESVRIEDIEKALKEHPSISAVYLTHSETSTGAATDVQAIARLVRGTSGALTIVDGITAVGAMELRMKEWDLDIVVTGSQKGLMIPPGLAFVAVSDRAWERMKASRLPKFYFDLSAARKALRLNDTPWTPAISLVIGVDAALSMIRKEGLEKVWLRHSKLAASLRVAADALGLEVLAKRPSNALTALKIPKSVDAKQFSSVLKNTYGITAAGGQGELAGKVIRISHLGYYDELDMITVISALEMTLSECGYRFEPGAGIRAAQTAFLAEHS
ncbi:MAG: alanine--glyoxylate aminotransferase family protein [Bacteroidota bacterium]